MRTVIFVGLLAIATAINDNAFSELVETFFSWVIVIAVTFDTVEFLYGLKQKSDY